LKPPPLQRSLPTPLGVSEAVLLLTLEKGHRQRAISRGLSMWWAARRRRPARTEPARSRALFETVAWMAMHRHRDRLPPPISEQAAERTCREIVLGMTEKASVTIMPSGA
jgi:hypothetical protein